MDLIDRVKGHFLESIAAKQDAMDALSPAVAAAAERMVACLMNEGKVLACGNGGSAAEPSTLLPKWLAVLKKSVRVWRLSPCLPTPRR
jgi:D-sedoheptulose 7-phosphate isomerase